MTWTPFSSEAVRLDTELRRAHKGGRTSEALHLIKAALEKAHREGPSNQTYEEFEAELERAASKQAAEEVEATGRSTTRVGLHSKTAQIEATTCAPGHVVATSRPVGRT